ncbi:Abi family protein [Corynebacterium sp. P7003]|uniref:Abi family protein n=1 Tax=Corynebacterium pygosceleis TaxID=2800406 RepID=A0ABT3WTD5_9CORY|nr:Abi family protein [Corynebacterium pygosceleis]MCX7445028.1 Abi family protein [Corynebacterium pygosceleis]
MQPPKPFRSHEAQLELLISRGMHVDDTDAAIATLRRVSYYRLSGYWFPLRVFDRASGRSLDRFQEGSTFETVVNLYDFDSRLRTAVFDELSTVELTVRAYLGHELGGIDPLIHLSSTKLGPFARQIPNGKKDTRHDIWLDKYRSTIRRSREDFVAHHRNRYGGDLPVWAAVEVLDWGGLSHLYSMSPRAVQNRISDRVNLTSPQFGSWLKSLNIVRNYCAHHSRMFNRVYDIKPKINDDHRLRPVRRAGNRAFGQLTLIQYLHHEYGLSDGTRIPLVLGSFPHNELVPFTRTGAPEDWRDLPLWRIPV